jgi:hypothetical protein
MNREKSLETILVLCTALVVVFLVTDIRHFLTAAVVLGVIGIFSKVLSHWIHLGWMKLSHILGAISGRVLLSLIFFVFLLPLSLLQKAFGKPTMLRQHGLNSYYKDRDKKYTAEDIENMW